MTTTAHADRSAFAALDDAKPNRFQLKIMFVSGMGFFTDAYDLFVIGIVVKIVLQTSGICRQFPDSSRLPRPPWPPQRSERSCSGGSPTCSGASGSTDLRS